MSKRARSHGLLDTVIPVIPAELDLFEERKQNRAIIAAEVQELKPVNAISSPSVTHLEFVSTGETNRMRNMRHVYLRLKFRLTKPDGSPLPQDRPEVPASGTQAAQPAYVAPKYAVVNNGFHSMIRSVNLHANGVDINQSSDYYAQRSYCETLVTFSPLHGYDRLAPELYR